MIDELYRDELRRLRQGGRAFAASHPDSARWLGEPGADPDVERLLEGVAFLNARIRTRLTEVDDEVAQALCAALLPTALRPLPALAVVRFAPAHGVREAQSVARGALLESSPVDGEPCRFTLAWDAAIPPAEVAALDLLPGEPPRLELTLALAEDAAPAALGRELVLYAPGEPPLARALVRALATARSVHAIAADGRITPLAARWLGPGAVPPVLPDDPGQGFGHALLAEALAWPELSRFVAVSGPPGLGLRVGDGGLRIVARLAELPDELRGAGPADLLTGCAPAINLWPAAAEPLLLDRARREHPLAVAGAPGARPWRVLAVRGSGQGRSARTWPPVSAGLSGPCWQELHLPGDDGAGMVVALGLSLPDAAAEREVLSVDLLAHDGGRAARVAAGELRHAVRGIPGTLTLRNLQPPSRPLAPPVGYGRSRAVAARLRLAAAGIRDADAARQLLDLHDRRGEAEGRGRHGVARIADAVVGLDIAPTAMPWEGAAMRVLVHRLELDEPSCGGMSGAWMLGNVLERALAALVPLGTATALHIACRASGRELRWTPRVAGATA